MPTIGGVTCSLVNIKYQAPTEQLDLWTIPGVDGTGVQKLGSRGRPFTAVGVLYDTNTNILTWFAAIEALQGGNPIVVVDDIPNTFSNLRVTSVERIGPVRIVGEGTTHRAEIVVKGVTA